MADSIYLSRSHGVAAAGIPDQYADGKAAKLWEMYIGSRQTRTDQYKEWIVKTLRDHNCVNVLDVACGTGVDSIMLLDEGFKLTSTDASDKMLKYALKERWDRRKEPAFDNWVIEESNWTTIYDEMKNHPTKPSDGYDAVICLGNSFAHMPDNSGHLHDQRKALDNFKRLLKVGGLLLIDHRNYDEILKSGLVPAKNIYYNSKHIRSIKCSNLYVDGRPTLVTMDYIMDVANLLDNENKDEEAHFRLSYYPHRLEEFSQVVGEVFKGCDQKIFGDFRALGEIAIPAYYIHLVKKA